MERAAIQKQWESAAPGWAKWEKIFENWMKPATGLMLDMAGVGPGSRVLDVACGAGSQTLAAARRVGNSGHIVASDISETMLQYVLHNGRAAGYSNISTMKGAAEELPVEPDSFDAVICRLGLMLFVEPDKAMKIFKRALKPGGRASVVVFTVPETNAFMAKPMQILLRHAGKKPPGPGKPGIFALGAPGVLEKVFTDCGFKEYEERKVSVSLRLPSFDDTLVMMQEAFGAYRAVVSDSPEKVRTAAWAEVAEYINVFRNSGGFEAPSEVLVGAGVK